MSARTHRTIRSMLAIAIAAFWRVLISSPRVMAGELPLLDKANGPNPEFHVVAFDVPPEKCQQIAIRLRQSTSVSGESKRETRGGTFDGGRVPSPSPSTLGEGWGEGNLYRALKILTPRPLAGSRLIRSLLPEYREKGKCQPARPAAVDRGSAKDLSYAPLFGIVPPARLISTASATLVRWFRRAPAAAT